MSETEIVQLFGITNKQYVVIRGSQTGHGCCFGATVLQRKKPTMESRDNYTTLCECFEQSDADRIATALNKT